MCAILRDTVTALYSSGLPASRRRVLLAIGRRRARPVRRGATPARGAGRGGQPGQISASVAAHGVTAYRISGGSPLADTTSRLRGSASGRCLDVDNASTAAGATVLIRDCHTVANQLWTTWAGGEIRVFGDKCLDADNQGTTNGTRVITWPCNGQNNQRWTLNAAGSVVNVHSGLCLAVEQAATANGSRLILWSRDNQANQKWSRV